MRRIRAVFRGGVLTPIDPVNLPEDTTVTLTFPDPDDLPASALVEVTLQGGAFEYLNDPREDVYSLDDGEPV